jgi:hypothetical protein
MHVVVAWHVRVESQQAGAELTAAIEAILAEHASVPVLPALHIVPVRTPDARTPLRMALVALARSRPGDVNLVVSPVIEGGTYAGWLPKSLWPQINAKTDDGVSS